MQPKRKERGIQRSWISVAARVEAEARQVKAMMHSPWAEIQAWPTSSTIKINDILHTIFKSQN